MPAILSPPPISKPGWQTDELEEEWVEAFLHDSPHSSNAGDTLTRSFVIPGSSQSVQSPEQGWNDDSQSPPKRGTFQIREDRPVAPIGPLEGKSKNRNAFKDFFTPLALETMFNPPSPQQMQVETNQDTVLKSSHSVTSTAYEGEEDMEFTGSRSNHSLRKDGEELEDVILASDIPNLVAFDGRKPSTSYQFTFSAEQPRSVERNPSFPASVPTVPTTDPRLRLFQFQYDTFTREHLSAVVDSIAVQIADSSKSSSPQGPPKDHLCQESLEEYSYLRAPKRLKLTPPEDSSINQPFKQPHSRRDYIGESRSLMQKIKETRSPSMMAIFSEQGGLSLNKEAKHTETDDKSKEPQIECMLYALYPAVPFLILLVPSFWSVDASSALTPASSRLTFNSVMPSSCLQPSTTCNSTPMHATYPTSTLTPSTPHSPHSPRLDSQPKSSAYRQQAADLMAQIRNDMTKGKRIFSLETHNEPTPNPNLDNESVVQVSITPASPNNTILGKQVSIHHEPTLPSEKQRKPIKPSPRKLLRRLSAADEVDREIAMNKSCSETSLIVELREPLPITTTDVIPPFIPAITGNSQLHISIQPQVIDVYHATIPNTNFFLSPANNGIIAEPTRIVSGGTTVSVETVDSALTRATTATSTTSLFTARSVSAGSVDSAASYVKHPGPVQITRITPDDVPAIPELVGGMRFDRTLMRWVKAHPKKAIQDEGALTVVSEESDDPFRDIESIHSGKLDETADRIKKAEESYAEMDDEEGNDVLATTTMVKVLSVDSDTDDSFDFDYGSGAVVEVMTGEESHDMVSETTGSEADPLVDILEETGGEDEDTILASTQPSLEKDYSAATTVNLSQTSTPAPSHRSNMPPRSVLKNGARSNKSIPQATSQTPRTPFRPGHRRSVSFSDGRKDGKIQGLGREGFEDDDDGPRPVLPIDISTPVTPSVRGRRIAAILDDLADLSLSDQGSSKRELSNYVYPSSDRTPSSSKQPVSRKAGIELSKNEQTNQTYLTECSFGVSHEKLVHIITDIHPYIPHWEQLAEIDLSGKGIESVARLKELLPRLDKVHLHLRELRADGNAITSLEGLEGLDGLTKVSLKGNRIGHIDFEEMHWPRLELLNLSRNELRNLTGLSSLSSLSALNLDHNQLTTLELDQAMHKLHTLRISNNRLTRFECARFGNVRTLYADNNRLSKVQGLERLRKLENLSLRNQGGQLDLSMKDIRDVKRLYLSGNPLPQLFLQDPCYNLIYLELAGCRLSSLPPNLSRLIPNIRVLNLNYNFLTDARALDGLTRLRKLTLIGSRLKGTKSLVRILKRMPDIEMMDFRMNPCTLGWYLPILVQDIPGALQPSEDQPHSGDDTNHGSRSGLPKQHPSRGVKATAAASLSRSHAQSWQELDAKFRGDLPDEAYVGRLAYRGLVMRACPKIKMLDGVVVSSGEKEKAERLFQDVLAAKKEKRHLVGDHAQ
ncbi:hypothetical protein Clacol_009835 [Clathrus columnatus]|uniref:Septation initiation network scaffold protein cdc11 n=1 Tax=Clathrus columnatus TaxID=1419009 RepID=A0AAV5ALK8_9AGAM|nr:hypothetical protein Clacol_009835 [Clathrus columnatus]